jgi:hypothetical protein
MPANFHQALKGRCNPKPQFNSRFRLALRTCASGAARGTALSIWPKQTTRARFGSFALQQRISVHQMEAQQLVGVNADRRLLELIYASKTCIDKFSMLAAKGEAVSRQHATQLTNDRRAIGGGASVNPDVLRGIDLNTLIKVWNSISVWSLIKAWRRINGCLSFGTRRPTSGVLACCAPVGPKDISPA